MDTPVGHTPEEDAAYRAGMTDSRLGSLEAHRSAVNGTIKATGEALQTLSIAVNDLRLTIKMLELTELAQRVRNLEDEAKVGIGVGDFKQWLFRASVAVVVAVTGLVALVIQLST